MSGNTFTAVPALCDPADLVLNGGYNVFGSTILDNDSLSTAVNQPLVGHYSIQGPPGITIVSFNKSIQ